MNTTLTALDLRHNDLGEGGGQAIAAALVVNNTLTNLNLNDRLGEGVKSAVRQSWGNRGGTLELDAVERRQRSTAATSLGHGTRAERP